MEKWKLEGQSFQKIDFMHQELIRITDESNAKMKALHDDCQKTIEVVHKQLWDVIYKEIKTDHNKRYRIDSSHRDLGFLVIHELEEKHRGCSIEIIGAAAS